MSKNRLSLLLAVLVISAMLLAACGSSDNQDMPNAANNMDSSNTANTANDDATEVEVVPTVSVADQKIVGTVVTISKVVSDGPGWLVVHAQADGKPGPILGFSAVSDGPNQNVVVDLNLENATETMYAMLHTDAGEVGTFEFPDGADGPVSVDGSVVTPAFAVSGLSSMLVPSVEVADQEIAGSTVIISEVISDGPGWLVVHAQADGKPGPILGFSPVSDGSNQNVTVELNLENATGTMYAMLHTDAGGVGTFEFPNGDDGPVSVDGSVVTPAFAVSGLPMPVPAAAVNLRDDPNLGSFLVDKIGMSLYIFLNDVPGTSNCYEGCAAAWPPLFSGDSPVAGEGVDASLLGTTTRDDGSIQVTYNGWPLYYFAGDANVGDVNGQDVNSVWYVIAPDGEIIN